MAALDGGVNPSNGDDDWSQGSSPADPRAVGGLADRFSALDVADHDPTSKTALSQVLNIGEAPESVAEEQVLFFNLFYHYYYFAIGMFMVRLWNGWRVLGFVIIWALEFEVVACYLLFSNLLDYHHGDYVIGRL